jgi:chromate transporter
MPSTAAPPGTEDHPVSRPLPAAAPPEPPAPRRDAGAPAPSRPGETAVPGSLGEFLLYFVRLGTFGFGGPIALAGHMQKDLVEDRRWVSGQDYLEGLALAQLMPGPLAAQLAMYLGWVRARVLGATLVSAAFILPSFAMTVALAWAYVRYGGLPWIQGAFYGIGAAVIAIIARSAWKLARMSLKKDLLLWAIFAATGLVTAATESENVWVFLGAGALAVLVRAPPRAAPAAAAAFVPAWLFTGLAGPAPDALWRILGFFAAAGAFVFGSGLAIVPFLHGGVVNEFHWLTERQFLDAVAVAMITPGPVVITVAFIGYLVAGPAGAFMAGLGVFLPTYLFVVIPAPYYRRIARNRQIAAFVAGVTAAATGAIAGAALVLGRRAVVDLPTAAIALVVLALLARARKVPEPVVILAAGVAGVLLRRGLAT